jgi:CRP/FNR family transcriptional regulator, cyclic AMP receptor protein
MNADLSTVAIFQSIPSNGLEALAKKGTRRTFAAGEVLMRQGQMSDCMHIIIDGMVQVERSHPEILSPVVLAELGPGTTVGEMGVLDDLPRTATATAMEETQTLELSASVLAETLQAYPTVATSLLRLLSKRLRSADELMDEMLRRRLS